MSFICLNMEVAPFMMVDMSGTTQRAPATNASSYGGGMRRMQAREMF
jgi:hypothetical protein